MIDFASNLTFDVWMSAVQADVEAALEAALPPETQTPTRLHQAMRYSALGGGKRVRPLLAYAAGALSQAPVAMLRAVAVAVECIHVYSLIHDDLPCMDDDVLRRGKATCHIAFDEATALLAGDSLQTLAFEVLSQAQLPVAPSQQVALLRILSQASGSRGMAGGQAIDLASVGQTISLAELENMHHHKTGALIRASLLLGAEAGSPLSEQQRQALAVFAQAVGLAFQVVDDVLDTVADTATLGKTAGKDAAHDKPTYVSLLGLAGAQALADELYAKAVDSLKPFGAASARLQALAEFIVTRRR